MRPLAHTPRQVVLAAAFDALPIAAYVLDASERVVYANRVARAEGRPKAHPSDAALRALRGFHVRAGLPDIDVPGRLASLAALWKLTRREREAFERLIEGATNKGIADSLCCAAATAGVHVFHVLHKAGFATRGALVAAFWTPVGT